MAGNARGPSDFLGPSKFVHYIFAFLNHMYNQVHSYEDDQVSLHHVSSHNEKGSSITSATVPAQRGISLRKNVLDYRTITFHLVKINELIILGNR